MALPPNRADQQGLLPLPLPPPAAQPQAQRGGRQGRGRGAQRQRRPETNLLPPRQAGPPPPPGAPRPAYLQTEATPDRNDPLWTTGLAGVELQPMPNIEYVYSGAEALPEVTSVLYASSVSSSKGFSSRITDAVFAYFCAVCTYARMLHLQGSNSLYVSQDEERFVAQVQSLDLEIPVLLAHYLAGFGNTRVPSGRDIRFRMLDRPDYVSTDRHRGWFGRVGVDTQPLYQQYPCLAVYGARILADLEAVEPFDRTWALPLAVVPDTEGGLGPSHALLGYGNRARISHSQRAFIEGLGLFSDEPMPTVNRSLELNIDLLVAVQNELNQIKNLKLSKMPWALVGSQAQLGRVRLEQEVVPIVYKSAVFECAYRLPAELTFPASAFGYRIVHDLDAVGPNVVAPWVVWRYNPAYAAWAEYAAAGNNLREHEPVFLSIAEFRTTPYLLRARLEALEKALGGAPG